MPEMLGILSETFTGYDWEDEWDQAGGMVAGLGYTQLRGVGHATY